MLMPRVAMASAAPSWAPRPRQQLSQVAQGAESGARSSCRCLQNMLSDTLNTMWGHASVYEMKLMCSHVLTPSAETACQCQ